MCISWYTFTYHIVGPRDNHVGATNGLDLLNAAKPLLAKQLVKVCNDLIEQPHALNALVVNSALLVVLREAGDRGKHHTNLRMVFIVELLCVCACVCACVCVHVCMCVCVCVCIYGKLQKELKVNTVLL